MKKYNMFLFVLLINLILMVISCTTVVEKKQEFDGQDFLKAAYNKSEDKEIFRVFITSDMYAVAQTDFEETIQRENDPGGDQYICDEIKKYDKIDESREGMYHVSLYPDRGTLKKVRPYKPLNLIELDSLILEDLQRWSLKFPKKVIQPHIFYVKYRIVLRKKQSDEQIIKEVQQKMKIEQ